MDGESDVLVSDGEKEESSWIEYDVKYRATPLLQAIRRAPSLAGTNRPATARLRRLLLMVVLCVTTARTIGLGVWG